MAAQRRFARAASVSLGLALALVLGMLGSSPAQAAPAAPSSLSPTGSTADHTPTLSWARVSGAVRYDVQVATDSSYTSVVFGKGTTNHRASVTNPLPTGPVYWRVRGVAADGATGSWSSARLDIAPSPGPTLLSPADGSTLAQPNNPPLLMWSQVPGATQYQIEVDQNTDFIGASTYWTATTSKVVPDAKADGTYYWHVRAQTGSGVYTDWSAVRRYTIGSLQTVTTILPVDSATTGATDLVFDWDPVPGARAYELRVDNNIDFSSPIEDKTVLSTRYSPPTTYPNNQYYWQIRAINLNGEYLSWDSPLVLVHSFKRFWDNDPNYPLITDNRPVLQYPADSGTTPVGDDFFYQWSPVRHASHYQLEMGTDPNFSPGKYQTCQTDNTTYTPGSPIGEACMPSQGVTYYWRVLAYDAPANVPSIYSPIHKFIYDSGRVMQTSPVNGASVTVPALSWQASQDAERYHVEVRNSSGQQVTGVDTYALTWTPTAKLPDGTYTWTVQAVDSDGKTSPKYSGSSFTVGGTPATTGVTPLTPVTPPASQRFPDLTWEPVANAAYYRINMGVHDSGYLFDPSKAPILSATFAYPSASDWTDALLTPGQYDWWVDAYDAQNNRIASGGPGTAAGLGTFTILDLDNAGGLQVALSGTALDAGYGCAAFLSDTSGAPTTCENAPSTPVLDWQPVPQAAFYMVYLSQDRSFTNYYPPVRTTNSRWTPSKAFAPSSLPDNNAGEAYYWLVRPCKSQTVCAPDPLSTQNPSDHSFSKQSPAVTGLTTGPTRNDVEFDWQDYRDTNLATTWLQTGEKSQQSAARYHIQISPSASFSSQVLDDYVDQTTYTVYADTLPEGTLYWRVQAIDAVGNRLPYSDTRNFVKSSPTPTLTSPTLGQTVSATPAFRWDSLPFAGSYQIEVYKNGDTAFSDVNRVISGQPTQSAYTFDRALAPSALPYIWRVRRLDATGKPGGWSAVGKFFVSGTAPTLGGPSSGTYVPRQDAYFTWTAVPGATTYLFERRLAGNSGIAESARTSGLSWASETIPDGSWEWRVTAYDASNNVLGVTAWRQFYVDGTRPTVTYKAPATSAKVTANFTVKFSERVKGVSAKTMRIYKKGSSTALGATVSVSSTGRQATLNPKRNLRRGKIYIVRLTGSRIKDGAGNTLVVPTWKVRAK